MLCVAAGLAFGFGPAALHPLVAVPFALAPGSRAGAFGGAGAWAGAATLPAGLAAFDYTDSVGTAALAWAVPAGTIALILGAAFAAPRRWRAPAVAVALVAISVPPVSGLAFVSPLPVAGLLFPGLGAVGLVALVAVLSLLAVVRPDERAVASGRRAGVRQAGAAVAVAAAAVTGVAVAVAATGVDPIPSPPSDADGPVVVGLDTYRGMPDARRAALFGPAWRMEEHDLAPAAAGGRGDRPGTVSSDDAVAHDVARRDAPGRLTVLWPEGVYGDRDPTAGALLVASPVRHVGGARIHVDETSYVNALVDGATGELLYAQRRPVPLAVDGAHRAVAGDRLPADRADEAGTDRIDALLCIELADPWLAATTFARADGPVLWAANLGWSTRPGLHRRMRATGEQWSALFDRPLVAAVNHPAPDGVGAGADPAGAGDA